ncbi:hypothetical protein R1sor_021206 [Riccia sorocarpa]|uniref:ribonuclease Z n=1 Tax=Riccia sorocarpa TaxID=122646 RepID=A0ABD3GJR2_9MARC
MESSADSPAYEVRIMHAAADGVEPALLISAPGKKGEYLVNVPDGFSRLALEHKSTPSGRLSCILLSSLLPAATGGLGGLMLRLRHDGHGQVQVIGPSGTTGVVHSLRHICRWRHPKVFVSECCGNRPIPVFEDEHIAIVPIVNGGRVIGCPWCVYRVRANSSCEQQSKTRSLPRSGSSNDESTSSSSDSFVANENSRHTGCSSDEEECSSDRREANRLLPQRRKREEGGKPPSLEEYHFFKQVRLKLQKSSRDRQSATNSLARESNKEPLLSNLRVSELEAKAATGFWTDAEGDKRSSGYEACKFVEQPAKELRQKSSDSSGEGFEWLIHNSQEVDLPNVDEEANPVFQLSPTSDKQQRGTEGIRSGSPPVLGFLCYLRKLDHSLLIVNCEKEEELQSLRAHHLLRCNSLPHSTPEEGGEGERRNEHSFAAVIDLSPRNMLLSKDYKAWIDSLRISGPHVVMKRAGGQFGFQSSLATLVKLNCIDSRIFPLPPGVMFNMIDNEASDKQATDADANLVDGELCMRLIVQKSGTSVDKSLCPDKLVKLQEEQRKMVFEPPDGGDDSIHANSTTPTLSANAAAAAALRRHLQPSVQGCGAHGNIRAGNSLSSSQQNSASPCRTPRTEQQEVSLSSLVCDFQLVFFGTGCAEPSKKRGCSGILLQVKGTDRAMLMEAGEGVAGQFVRRFGEVKAPSVLCSLNCLWLSHKHGDHVLGVLSILEGRRQQKEPLVVIGPQKVRLWLSEVKDIRAAMGCPLPEFHFIPCQELAVSGRLLESKESRNHLDRVLSSMQLQSIRLVGVFHCFDAYGIILRGKSGWSVVYSGDTRPCKALEYAGQGCSLLIHEATFEDELIEQAKQKRHCTVSEALKAGLQMGAQHIILTHFSQRYPEMVAMSGDQKQRVSVAFDGMVVPSHLLDPLSKLLPSISSVFQKREKIMIPISNYVIDGKIHEPKNGLVHAKADTRTKAEELDVHDGLRSDRLGTAAFHHLSTCLNTENQEDVELTRSKHIRFSDHHNLDREDPLADIPDNDHALNWSSESEDEDPFQLQVLKRLPPPVVSSVVERDMKAAAVLARGSSLVTSREASFDTLVGRKSRPLLTKPPSPMVSRETNSHSPAGGNEGCSHPRRSPKPQETGSGFKRSHRNATQRGEIRSSVDQFLKEIQQYEKIGMTGLSDKGESDRPSSAVLEESKPDGGKHIRWIDSGSEDENP